MTKDTNSDSIKERCLCCTHKKLARTMKFIARTGHWICVDCFSSVESGHYMVLSQLGYKWEKNAE